MINYSNATRNKEIINLEPNAYLRNRGITRIAVEYETVLCVVAKLTVNGKPQVRTVRSTFYRNNIDYTRVSFYKKAHVLDSVTKDCRWDVSLRGFVSEFIADNWAILIGVET